MNVSALGLTSCGEDFWAFCFVCINIGIFYDWNLDKYPIIWYDRLGWNSFNVLADCRDFPGALLGEELRFGEVLLWWSVLDEVIFSILISSSSGSQSSGKYDSKGLNPSNFSLYLCTPRLLFLFWFLWSAGVFFVEILMKCLIEIEILWWEHLIIRESYVLVSCKILRIFGFFVGDEVLGMTV